MMTPIRRRDARQGWARCGVAVVFLLVSMTAVAQESEVRVVPIIVTGEVVDAQGRPLRAVEMTVTEYRPIAGTFESTQTDRRIQIDGAFEVRCMDCSDLRLMFRAADHYPKRVGFDLTDDELKNLVFENTPPGYEIVRRGISVRMEACGASVTLLPVEMTLDLAREGARRVLVQDGIRPTIDLYQEVVRKRQEEGDGGDPAMVALTVEAAGFDELVKKASGFLPEKKAQTLALLEFSGGETGVIPMELSGDGPAGVYRRLLEAPEDGYAQYLAIDTETGKDQFFYCRLGGLYGKGRVSSLRTGFDRNLEKTLEVGLEILLNRDGGRNLNELAY